MKLELREFELGPVLGVGTVGTIYKATMPETGEVVALKVLLPSVSDDPLIKSRFRREMMILERLTHPHVVRYLGGGKDGKQLFYAMEYVDGGSLKQVLERSGPLRWKEAASIGIQLCSALQQLHNNGIIHRDLKPANLFFGKDGSLKLGDFGIARDTKAGDLTADHLTVGTYAYMSPEQIHGERDITGKTDLYALGCLLYEMLAGHPPYLGENFPQLFEQHLRAEPPSIRAVAKKCPEEFDALIRELLAKDPNARPFNARTVQGRLMNMLEGAQSALMDDSSEEDVAAAAVNSAQLLLSQRLRKLKIAPEHREVSWVSLACLALFIIGVVVLAWQLAG